MSSLANCRPLGSSVKIRPQSPEGSPVAGDFAFVAASRGMGKILMGGREAISYIVFARKFLGRVDCKADSGGKSSTRSTIRDIQCS